MIKASFPWCVSRSISPGAHTCTACNTNNQGVLIKPRSPHIESGRPPRFIRRFYSSLRTFLVLISRKDQRVFPADADGCGPTVAVSSPYFAASLMSRGDEIYRAACNSAPRAPPCAVTRVTPSPDNTLITFSNEIVHKLPLAATPGPLTPPDEPKKVQLALLMASFITVTNSDTPQRRFIFNLALCGINYRNIEPRTRKDARSGLELSGQVIVLRP